MFVYLISLSIGKRMYAKHDFWGRFLTLCKYFDLSNRSIQYTISEYLKYVPEVEAHFG